MGERRERWGGKVKKEGERWGGRGEKREMESEAMPTRGMRGKEYT